MNMFNFFFFFKQKTAYELRISDWSSDVCSSDLRGALVAFVTAGDPDPETSLAIVKGLPAAGADLIELGMPFSDPMADGPAVQASSLRALQAGMTLAKMLALVRAFRKDHGSQPVVPMGNDPQNAR